MKHGDKAKAKSAKALKASAKKSSSKASKGHEAKGKKSGKAETTPKSSPAKSKASPKKAVAKAPDNGKGHKARSAGEAGDFSNPIVAAAFKRAVRKYPNAFRRLTD